MIVCTDVLYYWEPVTLRVGTTALLDRLRPGGLLLAYHYRGDFGQANTADRVHDGLHAAAGRAGLDSHRHERHDGVGPHGSGVRFDVVARPVAGQRAAVAVTPWPGMVPAPRPAPLERVPSRSLSRAPLRPGAAGGAPP